jgi:hypothetical protein
VTAKISGIFFANTALRPAKDADADESFIVLDPKKKGAVCLIALSVVHALKNAAAVAAPSDKKPPDFSHKSFGEASYADVVNAVIGGVCAQGAPSVEASIDCFSKTMPAQVRNKLRIRVPELQRRAGPIKSVSPAALASMTGIANSSIDRKRAREVAAAGGGGAGGGGAGGGGAGTGGAQ